MCIRDRFGTPLKSNSSQIATEFRKQRSETFGPYADRAALHFVNCMENTTPGSAVFLILPLSVVATKHLAEFRTLVGSHDLVAMWICDTPMFDAAVKTCAVLAVVSPQSKLDSVKPTEPVALYRGESVTASSRSNASSWSELACLLYTSPSPRDRTRSRMPSSA